MTPHGCAGAAGTEVSTLFVWVCSGCRSFAVAALAQSNSHLSLLAPDPNAIRSKRVDFVNGVQLGRVFHSAGRRLQGGCRKKGPICPELKTRRSWCVPGQRDGFTLINRIGRGEEIDPGGCAAGGRAGPQPEGQES